MKYFTLIISSVLFAGIANAIERPDAEKNLPAPLPKEGQVLPQKKINPNGKESRPWLGLVSGVLPEVMRSHLDIAENEGLLVRGVAPNSPAAKAELQTNDILLKLNNKSIKDIKSLRSILAESKVGDKYDVEFLRKGQKVTKQIVLGEHPQGQALAALSAFVPDPNNPNRGAMPNAEQFRLMMEEMKKELLNGDQAFEGMLKDVENAQKNVLELKGMMNGNGPKVQNSMTMRMMDDKGSVEVRSINGSKEVTARDKEGNVVFEGPYQTEADMEATPQDVRERLERLNIRENGGGIQLRLGPDMFDAPKIAPKPKAEEPKVELPGDDLSK